MYERQGSWILPKDLEDLELDNTPQYDPYKDEMQGSDFLTTTEKTNTSAWVNKTIPRSRAPLPRGTHVTKDHILVYKCNDEGDAIGRAQADLILDTREYLVEFPQGKITELTVSISAETMHAWYNDSRNEFLLLDVVVAHLKDEKAVSLTDLEISVRRKPVIRK